MPCHAGPMHAPVGATADWPTAHVRPRCSRPARCTHGAASLAEGLDSYSMSHASELSERAIISSAATTSLLVRAEAYANAATPRHPPSVISAAGPWVRRTSSARPRLKACVPHWAARGNLSATAPNLTNARVSPYTTSGKRASPARRHRRWSTHTPHNLLPCATQTHFLHISSGSRLCFRAAKRMPALFSPA